MPILRSPHVGVVHNATLAALAALFWLVATAAGGRALEIRGIALTVSDLDRSVAFYERRWGSARSASG